MDHLILNPNNDKAMLAETALKALKTAQYAQTHNSGSVFVADGQKNDDGTDKGTGTLINGNTGGIQPWVNDTTPPGKPTGLSVSSKLAVVYVNWDGTLDGGIPDDFHHIQVLGQDSKGTTLDFGILREAGQCMKTDLTPGSTISVYAFAYDDAHDEQGKSTPNKSEQSETLTVEVESAVDPGTVEKAETDAQNALNQLALNADSAMGKKVNDSVVSSKTSYAVTTSPTTAPTTGWSTTQPAWKDGSFIWAKTTITKADGTTEESAPVVLTGPSGADGKDGEKGPAGPGSYTHVAYATSADGKTGFSVSDSVNKTYIGIYVDTTQADSTDPTKYAWTLVKGADGSNGTPGKPGVDGKTPYFHVAYATSADGKNGFDTTVTTGKTYIGNYTDYTQADSTDPTKYTWALFKGADGANGLPGAKGADGKDGEKGPAGASSYTHIAYADDAKGAGFSEDPTNKAYMGVYVDSTQSDSTDPTKYAWSLIKGANGANGTPGKAGADGKTPYFHIAYSTSADGKTGFSTTDSNGKTYLGNYTDYTQADSTDPTKYTWAKIQGPSGMNGTNGVGVKAITRYFQLATAAPAKPTVATAPSPWTTTEPGYTVGKNLYYTDEVLYDNGQFSYSTVQLQSAYKAIADLSNIAAKTYALPTVGNHPNYWMKLGVVTQKQQGKVAKIEVIASKGNNGSPNQNTTVVILIQRGWTGGDLAVQFGISVTKTNWPNAQVIGICNNKSNDCEIWLQCNDIAYLAGNYTISGYRDNWVNSNLHQDAVPGGQTQQNVGYWKSIDDAMSAAQTAFNTADSKSTVFLATTAPTAKNANDWWFKQAAADSGIIKKGDVIGIYKSTAAGADKWASYTLVANDIMVPSSVGTTLISDNAITTGKIVAQAITTNLIASKAINADKIDAGSISAALIQSGTFRTGSSGARVEITQNGIVAYNASGATTFKIDAKTGIATMVGATISSASGNDRTELSSTGLTAYKGNAPYVHVGSDTTYGMQLRDPTAQKMVDLSPMIFGSYYYHSDADLSLAPGANINSTMGGYTPWRDFETFKGSDGKYLTFSSPTGKFFVISRFWNPDIPAANDWSLVMGNLNFTQKPHGQLDNGLTPYGLVWSYGNMGPSFQHATQYSPCYPYSQFGVASLTPNTGYYLSISAKAFVTKNGAYGHVKGVDVFVMPI